MRVAHLCAALLLVTTLAARAADLPTVRYLLHVSPGGATDVMARKLANELQKQTGQIFVVENRPGGRGASQLSELKRAAPDGTTIGAVTNTHIAAFNQTLRSYDVDSFDWIAKLVYEPYVFVVRADSPIKSMADLVEAIKSAPSKLVVAGFVRGSGSHIAWEMFMAARHLPAASVNWVPYDSVGDSVTAVLGGHGAVTIAYVDLVHDYVTAKQLRVIGVMSPKRIEELPGVPTLDEQGIDVATSWEQWRGVIGPKGMPDAVKQRLAASIEKALHSPGPAGIHQGLLAGDGFPRSGRVHRLRASAEHRHSRLAETPRHRPVSPAVTARIPAALANGAGAALLLALAAFMWLGAADIEGGGNGLVGPDGFPRLIAALLGAGSLALLLLSIRDLRRGVAPIVITRPLAVAGAIVLVALYPVLITVLGFYAATVIWMVPFLLLAGMRSLIGIAASVAGFLLFTKVLFEMVLGTPLP